MTNDMANLTLEYLRRFDQRQDHMKGMLSDLRDRFSSMESQLSGFWGEFAGRRVISLAANIALLAWKCGLSASDSAWI